MYGSLLPAYGIARKAQGCSIIMLTQATGWELSVKIIAVDMQAMSF